jgi:adenosylmethionine-8-amino-7-oxononanoate aminotransferase
MTVAPDAGRRGGEQVRCRVVGIKHGYAGVSTNGQSVNAQVRQKVLREVASGGRFDTRPHHLSTGF